MPGLNKFSGAFTAYATPSTSVPLLLDAGYSRMPMGYDQEPQNYKKESEDYANKDFMSGMPKSYSVSQGQKDCMMAAKSVAYPRDDLQYQHDGLPSGYMTSPQMVPTSGPKNAGMTDFFCGYAQPADQGYAPYMHMPTQSEAQQPNAERLYLDQPPLNVSARIETIVYPSAAPAHDVQQLSAHDGLPRLRVSTIEIVHHASGDAGGRPGYGQGVTETGQSGFGDAIRARNQRFG